MQAAFALPSFMLVVVRRYLKGVTSLGAWDRGAERTRSVFCPRRISGLLSIASPAAAVVVVVVGCWAVIAQHNRAPRRPRPRSSAISGIFPRMSGISSLTILAIFERLFPPATPETPNSTMIPTLSPRPLPSSPSVLYSNHQLSSNLQGFQNLRVICDG